MPKAIFFDIDGTLSSAMVAGKSKIPESAIDAIHKTREKGNLCFLATGRSFPEVEDEILDIGFDGLVLAAGNNLVYKGESLIERHLSPQEARKIIEDLTKYDTAFLVEGNKGIYLNEKILRYEKEEKLFSFLSFVKTVEKEIDYEDVNKVCFFSDENTFEILKEKYDKKYTFFKASYVREDIASGEISLKDVSKGSTIRYMLKYLGIDKSDAYGFGDSDNDIEMFKECGTAIAMGEHRKTIEPYVNYITANVEDDGIKKAMEHFKLI